MFKIWKKYNGLMLEDFDGVYRTSIFGFENLESECRKSFPIADVGACFGYVGLGHIGVQVGNFISTILAGQFFSTRSGCVLHFPDNKFACIINRAHNFFGYPIIGGPIEEKGRLKYIDTCSDTLLIGPPTKGDPCFNHLHFPRCVDQTMHVHPSLRSGMIARGRGVCITPDNEYQLISGCIFSIPKDTQHKFRTESDTMDVIAFHPDSDWGPTHENHPMINRTWVNGEKMDNSRGIHATAEYMVGRYK